MQCLVIRIKVICYYTISGFLKIMILALSLPIQKQNANSFTTGKNIKKINLEMCFLSVPILNRYKVLI